MTKALDTPVKRTWQLKGCPRCQGDIYVEHYAGHNEENCLQCGYTRDTRPALAFVKRKERTKVR